MNQQENQKEDQKEDQPIKNRVIVVTGAGGCLWRE